MIISNIIWFVGIILLGETCTRKTCLNLGSLLEQERKDFEKAIEENKWFLSEKEGYDIGRQKAEKDFTQKHFKDWAEKEKEYFCMNFCPLKYGCKKSWKIFN